MKKTDTRMTLRRADGIFPSTFEAISIEEKHPNPLKVTGKDR